MQAIAIATAAQGPTRAPDDVRITRCASAAKRYTVLDVPGGRRSLPAALRATSMADVAVLVVSSTMGPQALTREHLLAALSARLTSIVVVINDINGDRDLLSACELEVRSLLVDHGADGDDVPVVTGSLRTGADDVAHAVLAAIDSFAVVLRDTAAAVVMRPMFHHPGLSQAAILVDGVGTSVASGRLMTGTLQRGDEVRLIGHRSASTWAERAADTFDVRARVARLQINSTAVDTVEAGEHCGLQLRFAGHAPLVDRFSTVIVGAEQPGPVSAVRARLTLRATAVGGPRRGLRAGCRVNLWSGPAAAAATIVLPVDDHDHELAVVDAGSTFDAVLLTSAPRFFQPGAPIALVSSAGVLAAGEVTRLVAGSERDGWHERAARFTRLARSARSAARQTP